MYYKLTLLFVLLSLLSSFTFAQTDRKGAIELYQKGNFFEATEILKETIKRDKADGEAWYYLGLSLMQTQKYGEAAKALEQSAKLLAPPDVRPYLSLAFYYLASNKLSDAEYQAKKALLVNPNEMQGYYFLNLAQRRQGYFKSAKETADKAISLDPNLPEFYWIKGQTIFAESLYDGKVGNKIKVLTEIQKVLESYPNLSANTEEGKFIRGKLESTKFFLEFPDDVSKIPSQQNPSQPEPGATPMKILSKPRPSYTDIARQNQEAGAIRLAVLFSASGTIDYVFPIRGLKYGLTGEAINAAYKIKFEPKTKDGKPVPVIRVLEYSFSIY